MTEITHFNENDFLSTLVFGFGGIFVFYLTPLIIFIFYYLQFRSANSDITIEGFTTRFIFYSMVVISLGGLIFSLLSIFSFSSVSNPTRSLYNFFAIPFDNLNEMFIQLNANNNLLDSEKEIIRYELIIIGILKIFFKSLSLSPIILIVYLLFVNIFKCLRKQDSGEVFNICFIKKSFFSFLFLVEIYIMFAFSDRMINYLIHTYTHIHQSVGILDTFREMFVETRNSVKDILNH